MPVTFAQLSPVQQGEAVPTTPTSPTKVREYVISDLRFEANDVVITPQNIKKLEVLANLLLIYPTLTMDLICHDVPSGPRSYTLFFSVKKAEQVAEFLEKKGVAANRLHVKGCGAYYPIAGGNGNALNNPAVDRLNRRIEVHVYHAEGQPVSLTVEKSNIPDELRDPRGEKFYRLQDQLLYRVQIANVPNLFEHAVFNEYSDAMVDYDPMTRKYRYLIGMETKFQNALVLRDALRKEGFTDAMVVPYINGEQVAPKDIAKYEEQYPDLLNFTQ